MIYLEIYLFTQLCLMSMINLMLIYKYYLVILITLELIIMNFSVFMFTMYSFMNLEMMFIYYLTFSVCESVMGLTILVLVIRFYGNDYYKSFSMHKF